MIIIIWSYLSRTSKRLLWLIYSTGPPKFIYILKEWFGYKSAALCGPLIKTFTYLLHFISTCQAKRNRHKGYLVLRLACCGLVMNVCLVVWKELLAIRRVVCSNKVMRERVFLMRLVAILWETLSSASLNLSAFILFCGLS